MTDTSSPEDIAERAVALSGDGKDRAGGPAALVKLAGDQLGPLEAARGILVRRIRARSDDYAATGGLSLLNSALAELGPVDALQWKPKVWRIPH